MAAASRRVTAASFIILMTYLHEDEETFLPALPNILPKSPEIPGKNKETEKTIDSVFGFELSKSLSIIILIHNTACAYVCICTHSTHVYIYTSTRGRSRLDSISPHTGLEMRPQELRGLDFYRLKDGILKESRIVCLTRSVSCSGVCPSLWPAWSSDPGRDTPWSQSSYEVPTVWGCWESGGGRPVLKTKGHSYYFCLISHPQCVYYICWSNYMHRIIHS